MPTHGSMDSNIVKLGTQSKDVDILDDIKQSKEE